MRALKRTAILPRRSRPGLRRREQDRRGRGRGGGKTVRALKPVHRK